jgi:hypothetical protein
MIAIARVVALRDPLYYHCQAVIAESRVNGILQEQ